MGPPSKKSAQPERFSTLLAKTGRSRRKIRAKPSPDTLQGTKGLPPFKAHVISRKKLQKKNCRSTRYDLAQKEGCGKSP